MVKKISEDRDIANVALGRVSSYTYFYLREEDGEIIGMINIRLTLNEFLEREGGHIGYSIRPTERGKNYATKMLSEALFFCKFIGLETIIITCDKSNLASARVIQKCGGKLDREFYSELFEITIQRYIIK